MPLPKILYEMSVLGYAATGKSHRTGVFRMVDQWAKGLALDQGQWDLSFASLLDPRTQLRSELYWSRHPELHQRPFVPRSLASGALKHLDALYLKMAEDPAAALPKRAFRRTLSEVITHWQNATVIQPGQLVSKADIFHGTFWPFPEGVRKPSKTRFLMTFVDLINLVAPEISSDGGTFFRNVLSTVNPDDFTVSISEATRKDLLECRPDLDPKRCFVCYLAASADFRPSEDPDGLRQKLAQRGLVPENYFLSVCTSERRKNLPYLIDAFEAWAGSKQNGADSKTELVLTGAAGSGHLLLRERLSRSPVRDRIRLLGYVPDTDLAPLYQGALAFVYPSLYEGFGLPILEALQCGAVVITSRNSSLTEVGGDAVLYCDGKNKESLVEALRIAAQDQGMREDLKRKGFEQAGRFSWQKSVECLSGIYKQMLA